MIRPPINDAKKKVPLDIRDAFMYLFSLTRPEKVININVFVIFISKVLRDNIATYENALAHF
jgi:hypothetical protein